jgi:hypothetical protein
MKPKTALLSVPVINNKAFILNTTSVILDAVGSLEQIAVAISIPHEFVSLSNMKSSFNSRQSKKLIRPTNYGDSVY